MVAEAADAAAEKAAGVADKVGLGGVFRTVWSPISSTLKVAFNKWTLTGVGIGAVACTMAAPVAVGAAVTKAAASESALSAIFGTAAAPFAAGGAPLVAKLKAGGAAFMAATPT